MSVAEKHRLESELDTVKNEIRDAIGENYGVFVDISHVLGHLDTSMAVLQEKLQKYETVVTVMDELTTLPPPPSLPADAHRKAHTETTEDQLPPKPDVKDQDANVAELQAVQFQGDTLLYVADLCSIFFRVVLKRIADSDADSATSARATLTYIMDLMGTMTKLFIRFAFSDGTFVNVTRGVFLARSMCEDIDNLAGMTLANCFDRVIHQPLEDAIVAAGQHVMARVLGQIDSDFCLNKKAASGTTPLTEILPDVLTDPDPRVTLDGSVQRPEDIRVLTTEAARALTKALFDLVANLEQINATSHGAAITRGISMVITAFVQRITEIETEPRRQPYDKQSLAAIADVHYVVAHLSGTLARRVERSFGACPELTALSSALAPNIDGLVVSFSQRRAAVLVNEKLKWSEQEYVLPQPVTEPSPSFQKVFVYLHSLSRQISAHLPSAFKRPILLQLLKEMVANMLVGPFWTRGPGHMTPMNPDGLTGLIVDLRFMLEVCSNVMDDALRRDINVLFDRAIKMSATPVDLASIEPDATKEVVKRGVDYVHQKLKIGKDVPLLG